GAATQTTDRVEEGARPGSNACGGPDRQGVGQPRREVDGRVAFAREGSRDKESAVAATVADPGEREGTTNPNTVRDETPGVVVASEGTGHASGERQPRRLRGLQQGKLPGLVCLRRGIREPSQRGRRGDPADRPEEADQGRPSGGSRSRRPGRRQASGSTA